MLFRIKSEIFKLKLDFFGVFLVNYEILKSVHILYYKEGKLHYEKVKMSLSQEMWWSTTSFESGLSKWVNFFKTVSDNLLLKFKEL